MRSRSSRSSSARAEKLSILLRAEEIRDRVRELAGEIDRHFGGREVLVVVVLRGAFVFAADLIRCMDSPVRVDFVCLESYWDGMHSTHTINVRSDLRESAEGAEVLVVEDIIDTGWSLAFLVAHLYELGASDVRICALLDKPSRREAQIHADFTGFEIPDVFVVGYGIDYAQRHRSLPDVYAISK